MFQLLRFAFSILILLGLVSVVVPVSNARPHTEATQPLDHIIGKPVATQTHLFWLRPLVDQSAVAVVSYDLRNGSMVVLHQAPNSTRSLVSDGATVAWIERTTAGRERIQGFDLHTHQMVTLAEAPTGFGGIALYNGMLVYQRSNANWRGLFLRTLETGEERQISSTGSRPVAMNGIVLWTEEQRDDPYLPAQSSLYMLQHNENEPQLLATTKGAFNSYSASGDYIAWTADAPATDRRVYLHRLSTGTTRPVSNIAGAFPVLNQTAVAWTSEPDTKLATQRTIQTLPFNGDASVPLSVTGGSTLATWAMTDDGRIVFTAEQGITATTHALYLVHPDKRDVQLPVAPKSAVPWTTQAVCAVPLQCGQVRIDGSYLVDNNGRWPVNGVQFFLPQYGINSWTFHDGYYWNSLADIDRWLDIAREQLNTRLLRIFVELPSGSNTPTTYATIYDFAIRASKRGMRLGLVLQNSSDFRMTTERRVWLNELIDYFDSRDASSLIAYASAANEINNWCATQDCYDNNPAYVDAANEWVAQFTSIFRDHDSHILTTVGIATEVRDLDSRVAWYDFFQPDKTGRTLAQLVDFLSPHNYGGGGYGIINDLRYELAYSGPVVLEEYGFPTDPKPRDARYSEGAPVCRDDPWKPECTNTAPFFVEWSTRAIRETSYAGGVAWMLADNVTKRCSSDPPDLWTGLFATTGNYCGGTYTTGQAQPKATAHRVRVHHDSYPPPPSSPSTQRWKWYLPIISKPS